MNGTRNPVLFIHGLRLHASSWEPWVSPFAEEGYAPLAPGWPGVPETVEEARANPESIANQGMGGRDHTVPEAITKATLKQYRGSDAVTDLFEFPDRGHSLTIDSGWRTVAGECLSWMAKQSL
ncbi:hypothetical protein EAS64_05510 [Trebonia kvetii]|uniref:Alpha/beta hydrolase n=1 Tax=Trebonia kvetii TaxID=2480626 RepID=A0A6P2C732_9ACTN|nr:hypothetical protein [Trebonia kvetii]TVZ06807.1 hypothetical protein EAS64_05510 [Trebonia kvetii]